MTGWGERRWRKSQFRYAVQQLAPLFRRETTWPAIPAVDVAETEKAYLITADVPGMDEKNIEVKVADGQ
jgi:HSP20 family protein